MIKVICKHIKYDTDGESVRGLPKSISFILDYDYDSVMADRAGSESLVDIEDTVSDMISDATGYCHTGFQYTIHKAE